MFPLTSYNAEKNNSGYPEERGGESLTEKQNRELLAFMSSSRTLADWLFSGGSAAA